MTKGYAAYLYKNGGIATGGGHLGLMVMSEKHVDRCPPGWIFIPKEDTSVQEIQECLDLLGQGRKAWPTKPDGGSPK